MGFLILLGERLDIDLSKVVFFLSETLSFLMAILGFFFGELELDDGGTICLLLYIQLNGTLFLGDVMEATSSSKSITNISQPGFFTTSCMEAQDPGLFSSLLPLGDKYEVEVEATLSGDKDEGVTDEVFLDNPEEFLRVWGYLMLLDEESAVAKLSSSSQKSEE